MIENHLGEETTKNLPEKMIPRETEIIENTSGKKMIENSQKAEMVENHLNAEIIEDPSGKQMIENILEEENTMNPLKKVDQRKILLGDVAVTAMTKEVVKEANIS